MHNQIIFIEKKRLAFNCLKSKIKDVIMTHPIYNKNDIYLGKISHILQSLSAAFINLNRIEKNGFINTKNLKFLKKENNLTINSTRIKLDDLILVQIIREPNNKKGPSVIYDIIISGKYITLSPLKTINKKKITFKNKPYIEGINKLLKSNKTELFLSTEILSKNATFLLKELKILEKNYEEILKKSQKLANPSLLSKEKKFVIKILEDYYLSTTSLIIIDSKKEAIKIKSIINKVYRPKFGIKLILEVYNPTHVIMIKYSLDLFISSCVQPKINLIGGGYIIIEKTEALIAIDVNSGSLSHLINLKNTILYTNYSATQEIINQIKLRNLGGIIVIDYIDCNNQNDQLKILNYLQDLLKKNFSKSDLIQISELGLVEITKSREEQTIYESTTELCNSCNGLGYITKSLKIKYSKKNELMIELSCSFSNQTQFSYEN